ncbi:MAG: xanthine dehydrogenase family protein molybdopterin-binding subunit [Xanthobacteraceae bacterium]
MSDVFKGRREDFRLVTGQGRYTADWNFPNQAYGQFLRSDHAHAEIAPLDLSEAKANPGVICILTGDDMVKAGFKSPPPISFFKGKNGTSLNNPHRHALAYKHVRFVGEPVALVVAETEAAALDALEKIAVEYRELPVVVEAGDALKSGAPQLHEDVPGNLAIEYELGNRAATDEAFGKAAHIVTLKLDAQRLSGVPMEPKSGLATYDPKTETYDIYMPTQGMNDVRGGLSFVTGVPPEKIRVHALDVGGAFGVRNEAYPEFIALFHAAKFAGRPVKWVGTRTESMLSDHHGRGAFLTGTLALDEKGNFTAIRAQWLVNVGAYASNAGPFINTAAAPTGMSASAYKTPAISGTNLLAFTNTTPTTAYRGAGRPNVSYMIERLIDEAARVTEIDRITLRRRNLISKNAFPYKTPVGATYDSGDPKALLDIALKESDWANFARRRREAKKRGKLRGIGCATFIEPSGGAGQEEVAIRFDAGDINLYAVCGPSGQGHETVFPEVVASVFGIPSDNIKLRYSDPDGPTLVGTGSFGSRSLLAHGSALNLGAKEVVRKGLELAAREMEVSPADVSFTDGKYRVTGTDVAVGFEDIVKKFAGTPDHPLNTTIKVNIAATWPGGAHIAEVEIDPLTGVLDIISYTAADDCGRVMNHKIVEGQLIGGIMQAVGQIKGEQNVYDRSGQMLSATFMDYFMPRADDLFSLAMFDHPSPSPNNPLGVKGAGEAGTTGCVPAIANAVIDALSPLGIHHLDTPFTPERVWGAINGREKR